MNEPNTPLEVETEYFESHRKEWIEGGHEGRWVVVQGEVVLGFFEDLGGGFDAGSEKWGDSPFMVRCVTLFDEPQTLQRVW